MLGNDPPNLTPTPREVKDTVADWWSLFSVYRAVVIRDDEVVQGVLRPGLDPEDPEVRMALDEWGGTHFLHQRADEVRLTLVRPRGPRPRERWWLHLLLGLATLLTTTIAGAYMAGASPLGMVRLPVGSWWVPLPVRLDVAQLLLGLAFSVPLLTILLGHELGHYLLARRRKMDVSPPYFIPSPNWINLIGTFGAFIRLRSPMLNRPMLLEVGVGGPVVSFVLSIPVALAGLLLSTRTAPMPGAPAGYVVPYAGEAIWLGSSLLFELLAWLAGGGEGVVILHPVAFAGWLGLFVTALNLFPLSQLDGGHIIYALVGARQRPVAWVFLGVLLLLGYEGWGGWWGWWFWLALILLLGRASVAHPPVFDPDLPVPPRWRLVGWACVVIFFLTFIPVPFQL